MRVVLEGNIGSGKSSVLAELGGMLGDGWELFPEPVDEWTDLLRAFYEDPCGSAFLLQTKVLCSFRRPALLASPNCVVERSPWACRHVFGQLAFNAGHMTAAEWGVFKECCELLSWTPDLFVFLDVDADTCWQRVNARGRAAESTITETYTARVGQQYAAMSRYLPVGARRVDVRCDDGSSAREIARKIADLIEEETARRRASPPADAT